MANVLMLSCEFIHEPVTNVYRRHWLHREVDLCSISNVYRRHWAEKMKGSQVNGVDLCSISNLRQSSKKLATKKPRNYSVVGTLICKNKQHIFIGSTVDQFSLYSGPNESEKAK
ncbi:hypothetical protein Droror1_Dr00008435 [Drosera rotundifolia]